MHERQIVQQRRVKWSEQERLVVGSDGGARVATLERCVPALLGTARLSDLRRFGRLATRSIRVE